MKTVSFIKSEKMIPEISRKQQLQRDALPFPPPGLFAHASGFGVEGCSHSWVKQWLEAHIPAI